jgi:hypothetical protein
MTCTRSPYVLDSLRRFSPPGTPRNSPWLLRCMIEATSIFTMLEALRPRCAATLRTRCPRVVFLADSDHERRPIGRCGARWDETSDTSVTSPSSSSRSRHLRACSRVPPARPYGFGRHVRVGRVKCPPRPSLSSTREDRCLEMIRGAFHRQEPFVGSGGHYSPGPATASPLLAMVQPLDDALTSPWALSRSASRLLKGSIRDAIRRFERARAPTFDRRHSPRPRPPFARP